MGKYLTEEGLTHFWTVVKAWIVTQLSSKASTDIATTSSNGLMSSADKTAISHSLMFSTTGGFDSTQSPVLFDGHPSTAFLYRVDTVDGLTSTDAVLPLSANQGRVLNETISTLNASLNSLTSTVSSHTTSISTLTTSVNDLNTNVVLKSNVVDNTTSTDTEKPLSANQGKVLNDTISSLNTALSNLTSTVSSHTTSINSLNTNAVMTSSIVDALTSTSATVPLSANQGRVLNSSISSLSSTVSSHTSSISSLNSSVSSLNTSVNAKFPTAGGTFTGIVTAYSNTSYTTKQVRNITFSTASPSASDGANGDVWLVYS
jgi:prefoldin subunit 5